MSLCSETCLEILSLFQELVSLNGLDNVPNDTFGDLEVGWNRQ